MQDELCLNYASALYGMLEPDARPLAMDALEAVCRDLKQEQGLSSLLSSYNLSRQEKQEVVERIYGKKFAKIPHFISFLKVIIDHHRIQKMPGINAAFRTLVHEDLGVKEGIIYAASALSKEQIASIEGAIAKSIGSKVSLTLTVDHKLLGGVKVYVDGKVYDGSLSTRLARMRRTLKGGTQS